MKPEATHKVRLYPSAFCCPDPRCKSAPYVVVEQRLYIKEARRRFYAICPICERGFRIGAAWVQENVQVELPAKTHVFAIDPNFDEAETDIQEADERYRSAYRGKKPRLHVADQPRRENEPRRRKGRRGEK